MYTYIYNLLFWSSNSEITTHGTQELTTTAQTTSPSWHIQCTFDQIHFNHYINDYI